MLLNLLNYAVNEEKEFFLGGKLIFP